MTLKKRGGDVNPEDVIADMGLTRGDSTAEYTGLTQGKPSGTDAADPERQRQRDERQAEAEQAATAAAVPAEDLKAIVENAMVRLSDRSDDRATAAIEKLALVMERLVGVQSAAADRQREDRLRHERPENPVSTGNSVFNRRGRDPKQGSTPLELHLATLKPPLKCPMAIPEMADWESLTREEVMLLNLIEAGQYVISRIDRTKINLSVQMRYKEDGHTPAMMLILHDTAYNNDNFRLMPPKADMLRMMLKQHDKPTAQKAAAILSDEEEEALIEAGDLLATT